MSIRSRLSPLSNRALAPELGRELVRDECEFVGDQFLEGREEMLERLCALQVADDEGLLDTGPHLIDELYAVRHGGFLRRYT
jgi:hypothetical protein